jgi:hypothetical protein
MTHDLLTCGIASSGAIDLKKPTPQKNLSSTFGPYDWLSSQSLAFPDPDAIDFTWVAMFVTMASNHANLASMVLGWP